MRGASGGPRNVHEAILGHPGTLKESKWVSLVEICLPKIMREITTFPPQLKKIFILVVYNITEIANEDILFYFIF